ncbi:zinc finger CCCH domain-containing protein 3 [Ceratina calcarata]|uniref:Zinc finger CCCH domain-containing protein 3 n=1 Tax=Ceratina calcarata TaxID=156304 RepID=A0AAJ7JBJ0_9HYME|nr:zinc finger CCCH domain-containing protein 3 [Ceratina calcarata]
MDESLIKEIHYLTRLIESHKKKSLNKLCCVTKPVMNENLNFARSEKCASIMQKTQSLIKPFNDYSCSELASTNVYINPNFKPQNSAIYINPKLHVKSLVHVNPKMMRNIVKSTDNVQSNSVNIVNTSTKQNPTPNQMIVQKSVYVNPKLIKKLSHSVQSKPTEHKEVVVPNVTQPVCSRLKLVKSTVSPKASPNQKKTNNSNILILSRRKLVRVRRSTRKSLNNSQVELRKVRRSTNLVLGNSRSIPQKIVKTKVINTSQQSLSKEVTVVKSPIVKSKINKYRIDRTSRKIGSIREPAKKTVNNKVELITIGGIVYKSSKNQLVRRSYSAKKKRLSNVKADKFIVATNGKKLCRVKSAKETSGNTSVRTSSVASGNRYSANVLQKINYKNNISNKVKQKSIQILRNKMQKNNHPCLIFQKFGYCSNHAKGVCVKRHDRKQVSLCKKFLQGTCLSDNCPLSHDVGPEKMPTCKYFLEGCCTRDACPYRHIKVSSSTPICIDFLQGYCAKGSECKQRHENLCPEFDKTNKCSKGKHCPYPHKTQLTPNKQSHLKRKYNTSSNRAVSSVPKDTFTSNTESKLRYYEQADTLNKSLDKKRENIMKKMKLMRKVESLGNSNTPIEISDSSTNSDISGDSDESETVSSRQVLKRPPIGVLPAYIPID